jgi:hypothetical protein
MPGRLCFGPCALKFPQFGGGGGLERETDKVSRSRLNPEQERQIRFAVLGSTQNRGGMVPGTTTNCVAAVHGALPRLSLELSLLHTMYVEWKTRISQNMFDIVKSCHELKFHFSLK